MCVEQFHYERFSYTKSVKIMNARGGWLSCFEPPHSDFTDLGSIHGQGKIINVPVFYHEVKMEDNNNA